MIRELDAVRVVRDLPEQGLHEGDEGTVVHVYANGAAFEVEFTGLEGSDWPMVTLTPDQVQLFASPEAAPMEKPLA